MNVPCPSYSLVLTLEIIEMPLSCLFLPFFLSNTRKCSSLFPWVRKLVPPRIAQPWVASRGGGELRLRPAQRSGEATARRWGGGRSRPKGGEGGRRRTRVPGLVTAGGPGNPRPDRRRWQAEGTGVSWAPSTCCCWWPPCPWRPGVSVGGPQPGPRRR